MEIKWKLLTKEFEKDQKENGTECAIKNVLWNLAAEIMKATGVTRIKTSYKKLNK